MSGIVVGKGRTWETEVGVSAIAMDCQDVLGATNVVTVNTGAARLAIYANTADMRLLAHMLTAAADAEDAHKLPAIVEEE
jgi:hypothetical protein